MLASNSVPCLCASFFLKSLQSAQARSVTLHLSSICTLASLHYAHYVLNSAQCYSNLYLSVVGKKGCWFVVKPPSHSVWPLPVALVSLPNKFYRCLEKKIKNQGPEKEEGCWFEICDRHALRKYLHFRLLHH